MASKALKYTASRQYLTQIAISTRARNNVLLSGDSRQLGSLTDDRRTDIESYLIPTICYRRPRKHRTTHRLYSFFCLKHASPISMHLPASIDAAHFSLSIDVNCALYPDQRDKSIHPATSPTPKRSTLPSNPFHTSRSFSMR